ncbi:integral inner membrane protein [Agrilactobacillus composti DSM 18527 = JCM 14202]|uniref:Integral inner membrane protein n=1 Tax=Agrilactobacillus composti DSM 18527 = JCM 14202 TaxID=1423734 RepID=X0PEA2_9LACO|nr:CvpA family protein [Agrilactobacillus composti]KRM32455.1 integral inner membrane protein [Agrilactobacillus composti DSM 18527 = JCM 14202]GAF39879.1 colicin V production protein [Agrilactobacillus composti DSM 18527 = JCM 14202]
MLSFLIILVLAYGIYIGARRGLILQTIYSISYLVFFGIAYLIYRGLGSNLTLLIPYPSATTSSHFAFFDASLGLKLDTAFYAGFAFLLILLIGWLIMKFVGLFLAPLQFYPMNYSMSVLGAMILAFVTNYVGIFLILYLVALIPVDGLQAALGHSWVSTGMVRYSPILTDLITKWWIVTP